MTYMSLFKIAQYYLYIYHNTFFNVFLLFIIFKLLLIFSLNLLKSENARKSIHSTNYNLTTSDIMTSNLRLAIFCTQYSAPCTYNIVLYSFMCSICKTALCINVFKKDMYLMLTHFTFL